MQWAWHVNMALSSLGNVRTTNNPAFTKEEFGRHSEEAAVAQR